MTRAHRESRPPLEPRNLKEVVNNLLRAETRSFMGVKNCNVSSPLVLMGGKMPLFGACPNTRGLLPLGAAKCPIPT